MNANNEDTDITLSLLQSIAEKPNVTQRSLAKRLGLALGLTNHYLKACVRSGLVKIEQVPANKYLYYLTPKGFACKGKLMTSQLNASLQVFREAQLECSRFFNFCLKNNFNEVAILGENDLSEIALLIGNNSRLKFSIVSSLTMGIDLYDAWVIVDAKYAQLHYDSLIEQIPLERIFCFSILKIKEKSCEQQL